MATSDLHVHVLPYDYYTGTSTDRLGLARTASLIAAARGEVENCLLFDNGDFLQGSPLGDYIAQSRGLQAGDVHPIVGAMNHLRYDAGTLGNHEFNYGLDFLTASLAGADFPIVAANVLLADQSTGKKTFVPPYVILERTFVDGRGARHHLKIGVIGFTPPQILTWDHRHLAGKLNSCDIVEAARFYVPQMQREGANVIIALSHSGIGSSEATPGMENASTALARIDGIDAVIAGHSHLVFPSDDFAGTPEIDPASGTLCGKPAVMPGFYGSHLGVIDLDLLPENGTYKVHRHKSSVRPIWHRGTTGMGAAMVESHVGLVKHASKMHRETLDWANQPIGHTDVPLHSFFALVADAPAVQLVAAAQVLHVKTALSTTAFAGLPVLASVAPFKAGGRGGPDNYTDIPSGDVMLRHAADLYIHTNTSAAVRMTGGEIASWLEYGVGIFNQIPPGSTDAVLINPDFPSFNFDLIFGLGYQIDLSKPPRFDLRGALINPHSHRIVGLSYHGVPLDPPADFVIATNSYRIAANARLLPPAEDRVLYQSTETNVDVVRQYFGAQRIATGVPAAASRFAALPDTSVIFDTSPKALAHMADVQGIRIEPIGLTQTGFLRFRLHL